jgi:hypothetical protein
MADPEPKPGPAPTPNLLSDPPNGPAQSAMPQAQSAPPVPGPEPTPVQTQPQVETAPRLPNDPRGPLKVTRDGAETEITKYQQAGKIKIQGDVVEQEIGRGKTAEYSLHQLAAHAENPKLFRETMEYAAKHKDSVKIDVHDGVSSVRDIRLEHSLPANMPLREPILQAAMKHDIDPKLLAAVGVQETHLGADYLGASGGYDKTTHRGDADSESPGGHGYGPFQLDDQKRGGNPGRPQAMLDKAASDPYYAADVAAGMLAQNLQKHGGDVSKALHDYNAGSPDVPSTTTDWGPKIGKLPYEDSTLRYYDQIDAKLQHEQKGLQR